MFKLFIEDISTFNKLHFNNYQCYLYLQNKFRKNLMMLYDKLDY
jgi:hypothetical protein